MALRRNTHKSLWIRCFCYTSQVNSFSIKFSHLNTELNCRMESRDVQRPTLYRIDDYILFIFRSPSVIIDMHCKIYISISYNCFIQRFAPTLRHSGTRLLRQSLCYFEFIAWSLNFSASLYWLSYLCTSEALLPTWKPFPSDRKLAMQSYTFRAPHAKSFNRKECTNKISEKTSHKFCYLFDCLLYVFL